jgi:hypothetical protein
MRKLVKRLNTAAVAALMLVASMFASAQTLSPFSIFPDTTRQFSSSVLIPPTYTDAIVLVANVSQTQAVPTGANWVIFSADCNFYAKTGASAAVPGATTTTGAAAMQNPAAWNVIGITQITVVAATACKVTLSFYQ